MSAYAEIAYAIHNSRTILAQYGEQEDIRKIHGNVLIEKVADEIQRKIQAPRGLIIAKLLSALSVGLQHCVDIQRFGEALPASCYFITLAESGERKTAVESAAFKPIYDFQKKLDDEYEKRNVEYFSEIEVFEEKKKFLKKSVARLMGKGECSESAENQLKELYKKRPTPPCDLQVIHTDSSPEALIDQMSRGCKYAAIASGEGGVVLKSSAIKSPAILSLFNGETVKISRKTSGSSVVVDGRLTVSIDVQPGVFEAFCIKHGEIMEASGFFARAFISKPKSTIGSRFHSIEESSSFGEVYDEYVDRLGGYIRLLPETLSGDLPRRLVTLDCEANRTMASIMNAIEYETNQGGMFDGHSAYASKLGEKILRLACLLSVFEQGPEKQVSAAVIEHALHLAMYFVKQHKDIFSHATQEEKDAALLLKWIEKKRNMGVRYIRRNAVRRIVVPEALRSSKRLNLAIDALVSQHHIALYYSDKTACLDLSPHLPVDYQTAMSVGQPVSNLL